MAQAKQLDQYRQRMQKENRLRKKLYKRAKNLGEPVPELYFATVRAIGTPLADTVVNPLSEELERHGYLLKTIKLSERLVEETVGLDQEAMARLAPHERYDRLTAAGERFCKQAGRRDALVIAAIKHLHYELRKKARKQARREGYEGVAYLFRNVMHPAEVERLRKLYGCQLYVISAFSPEKDRFAHLKIVLAGDDPMQAEDLGSEAARLIQRETGRLLPDEDDGADGVVPPKFRMNVPATWQHADLFLDISDSDTLEEQISRLIQLIFANPFRTPRAEENGMAAAFSAATESANLARRVGAAIASPNDDVVAIGTNDAPKPGGGVYRAGRRPDQRDHTPQWAHDPSDRHRRAILRDLVQRMLREPDWLKLLDEPSGPGKAQSTPGQELAKLLKTPKGRERSAERMKAIAHELINSDSVWRSQFFDVIEYGRTLHAEMDAITSAARKGASTTGGTLYCTTLPCHECARLIIGAGIKRVIFVEPYEKSRAMALYRTEIELHTMHSSLRNENDGKVHFIPYVGISPRRFQELFSWMPRKRDDTRSGKKGKEGERKLDGAIVRWKPNDSTLRDSIMTASSVDSVSRFFDLLIHERRTIKDFKKDVKRNRS